MNKKKEIVPKLRFPEFKNNEFWLYDFLGCLSTVLRGGSPRPIDEYLTSDTNSMNWLKIGDINKEDKYITKTSERVKNQALDKTRVVHSGDLIMSNSMSFGRPYLLKISTCIHDGWIAITEINSNVNKEYLYYYILSDISQIYFMQSAAGGGIKNLNAEIIKKLIVLYPENVIEQQKIADCLSSLDELIDTERRKLKALEKYKKGLMQKLFPAEGKTLPEWRFPEFQDCEEWETVKLEKLALYRRGSFPQPYGLPEWYDEKSGMPFIQVFDVDDNMKLKSNTKNKISELAAQQSVFIPKGTLIITIQGSIGRVAITQYDAYIDRTLLLFEKFFRKIDKTFLAYNLQLLFDIEKQKAPGGIIKTITKQALSEFLTSIPRIEEQEKIAGCLSEVDTMITEQSNKVEQLKAHKKGLMQGLFPSLEEADV